MRYYVEHNGDVVNDAAEQNENVEDRMVVLNAFPGEEYNPERICDAARHR